MSPAFLPYAAPIAGRNQDDTTELAAGTPVFGLALPYPTAPVGRTLTATPVATVTAVPQIVNTATGQPVGTPGLPAPTAPTSPEVTTIPPDVTPSVSTLTPTPTTSLPVPAPQTTGGITATPVPEPSGIGVLSVALLALAVARQLIRSRRGAARI